ncbi:MAG: baseplate J/gp47 family protein [Lachnospiraceae bacterium]|nr:baseplate J/gp47 family protein [Lachnospiraceae bacterium]
MYEDITYEKILDRMLARVPDKFDKREGSVIWDTHSPTAIELQILYIELDRILREAYGDTASREFLILRCRERGIIPHEATKAVLKGVFVPADIDVSGQRFNIGALNYAVGEKIADGEYRVVCETAGKTGNQFLGAMTPMEYIKGLKTAELTEILIPGEDEEETEDLRQRYFASFDENAFGGNRADYLEKTNAIPGVGRTKVTRIWNSGISPTDMIPKESVERWYNDSRDTFGEEVQSWLDAVFHAAKQKKLTTGGTVLLTIINSEFGIASDTLVQTVQTIMDPEENAGEGYGFAPIGHVVKVESAAAREVCVRADITFDTGYGWENLQNSIEEAVSAYLLELRKAWADAPGLIVRVSQIENRILGITGILDIRDTCLNGFAQNLILEKYEIPVFGGVGG